MSPCGDFMKRDRKDAKSQRTWRAAAKEFQLDVAGMLRPETPNIHSCLPRPPQQHTNQHPSVSGIRLTVSPAPLHGEAMIAEGQNQFSEDTGPMLSQL